MQPDHYLVKIVPDKSTLSPGPISVMYREWEHAMHFMCRPWISVIFNILKGMVKKGGLGVVNKILKIKT